jgi:hypothetical protein
MNEQKTSRRHLGKALMNALWGLGIGTVIFGWDVSAELLAPEGLSASTVIWAIIPISLCASAGFWSGWTGHSVQDWWGRTDAPRPLRPRPHPRRVNAIQRHRIGRRPANKAINSGRALARYPETPRPDERG